jgi:uncharacterized protein YndB with AHSA1/START domain
MQYEIDIDIDSGPEAVWAVLTDIERWPEWTASMTRVRRLGDGEFSDGSAARVKQPWLPTSVLTVNEYQHGKYFSWITKRPGITTVATHDLIAGADGSTNVRLTLHQTGTLAPIVGLFLSRRMRRYVDMEAHGLKRRCEA